MMLSRYSAIMAFRSHGQTRGVDGDAVPLHYFWGADGSNIRKLLRRQEIFPASPSYFGSYMNWFMARV